jgi:hypothetical protein
MFIQTFNAHGDLNDRFLQNVHFSSNKSILEIYRMTENNRFFKFLVNNGVGDYIINEVPAIFN